MGAPDRAAEVATSSATSEIAEINNEHRLAHSCAADAISHAVRCGELLARKKKGVRHGQFQDWVQINCEFKYSTAARYMKAATQISMGVEICSLSALFPSGRPGSSQHTEPSVPSDAPLLSQSKSGDTAATPTTTDDATPEIYEPDDDELADMEKYEAEYMASIDKVMEADDKLAAAHIEIKRQAAEIAVLKINRDGYMGGQGAAVRLLKAEQSKTRRLLREIDSLRARLARVSQGSPAPVVASKQRLASVPPTPAKPATVTTTAVAVPKVPTDKDGRFIPLIPCARCGGEGCRWCQCPVAPRAQ
jgi:hypothetical protein